MRIPTYAQAVDVSGATIIEQIETVEGRSEQRRPDYLAPAFPQRRTLRLAQLSGRHGLR